MIKDDVLNRFNKYKNDYKLLNILYGIKAIEKMGFVFYPHDKTSQNKWIKSMKNKKDNCVYFVYNHKKKGKSHRFLAKNSDLGEPFNKCKTIKKRKSVKSRKMKGGYPQWFDDVPKGMSLKKYLRFKKSKPKNKSMKVWIKENKKYTKKKIQKGGVVCAPCILSSLGPLAGAVGLGSSIFAMSKISNKNGKKSINRIEKYQINKNGEINKKEFKQKNNRVYVDGEKVSEFKTIKKATSKYNDLINKCKEKGFKKC